MIGNPKGLVPERRILRTILVVRGEKVILDSDLAELYGVETRRLNEQVRRNIEKFPEDFMFRLSKEEFENLKSQFATSSSGWGGRRKLPLVFTEHGALQVANVLNSERANKMSVFIVRAFIRLREMALTNEKLSQKITELERRVSDHDEILIDLIREIRKLIDTPMPKEKGKPSSPGLWGGRRATGAYYPERGRFAMLRAGYNQPLTSKFA